MAGHCGKFVPFVPFVPLGVKMTAPADLRLPELAPDARRRLAEIARQQSELAAEAQHLIAAMAAKPERAADHVDGVDHHDDDAPSPGNLIAVKPAAHEWRMTEKRLRRIAASHEALHKIGGRWMIDGEKLSAAVFR